MINRRRFLTTAAASAALAPVASFAQEATQTSEVPEYLLPRIVRISEEFTPGEIHVLPSEFSLYWTMPDQKAIRYAVGIGRPGLYEAGEFYVGAKKEWPSWRPTDDMIRRQPEQYEQFADGMPGGVNNPLGARALYLFAPGRGDTFLRIHGTNRPSTIGTAVSNGCARLVNSHMVHLYNQVPLQTRVVLYSAA
ncbi:L,D-transpeptidase [Aliiroseovarius sp. YM-037]|uniref:L,D-transpeptidase n=1 Tax=Aliiroseovarius sp. YM-037 TaxID=3341728 RepID=UPI003A8087AA